MSLIEFAQGDFETAGHAALIGNALQSLGRPVLEKAMGAGLIYADGQLRPMVLILSNWPETSFSVRPLYETPVMGILLEAFGDDPGWLKGAMALITPSPEPFVAVADFISLPNPGRVGCQIRWNGGTGF